MTSDEEAEREAWQEYTRDTDWNQMPDANMSALLAHGAGWHAASVHARSRQADAAIRECAALCGDLEGICGDNAEGRSEPEFREAIAGEYVARKLKQRILALLSEPKSDES